MSRRTGLLFQNAGMTIMVTVMLIDRFLFSLQPLFLLVCALASAVLLTVGIRTLKRYDKHRY